MLFICTCAPPRHNQLPSGSMKILETKVSDSGLYVCVASNFAGNLTQTIELNVLGKFQFFQNSCLSESAVFEVVTDIPV